MAITDSNMGDANEYIDLIRCESMRFGVFLLKFKSNADCCKRTLEMYEMIGFTFGEPLRHPFLPSMFFLSVQQHHLVKISGV